MACHSMPVRHKVKAHPAPLRVKHEVFENGVGVLVLLQKARSGSSDGADPGPLVDSLFLESVSML